MQFSSLNPVLKNKLALGSVRLRFIHGSRKFDILIKSAVLNFASFFFLFFFFYKPLYKTARLPSLFALAATSRADEQSATPRRVHVFRALHVSETGGKSTACCENELIATLDERKATEVIDHRRLFIFFFPFPFLRAKNEIEISTSIFLREITSKRTSRSAR